MTRFVKVRSEYVTQNDTLFKIYNSIRPLYVICRIVGLNNIRFRENQELKIEKSDLFYFGFYFTVYLLFSIYSLVYLLIDKKTSIIVGNIIVFIECSVMITLMLVVVLFTFLSRRIQIKAFDLLAQIDVTFIKNGFSFQYHSLLKNNYTILSFMAVSLTIRSLLLFFTVQVDLIQFATLVASALIKALSIYQFVVFILQLQLRFTKINSVIASFYKDSKFNKMVLSPVLKNIPEQLYTLCRLHYKLASVCQKINAAFAVQLLVSTAVSLFDILFQAYCLYYVSTGKAENLTVPLIIAPIMWLLDEIVQIYWLVYACASTCDQANETPTILHELRNHYFDVELEGHVQTYSLQMLHQKVQFSILGFFVVDYTLIYSIVGAVTTYLVIFIQFDQSSGGDAFDSTNDTSSY